MNRLLLTAHYEIQEALDTGELVTTMLVHPKTVYEVEKWLDAKYDGADVEIVETRSLSAWYTGDLEYRAPNGFVYARILARSGEREVES